MFWVVVSSLFYSRFPNSYLPSSPLKPLVISWQLASMYFSPFSPPPPFLFLSFPYVFRFLRICKNFYETIVRGWCYKSNSVPASRLILLSLNCSHLWRTSTLKRWRHSVRILPALSRRPRIGFKEVLRFIGIILPLFSPSTITGSKLWTAKIPSVSKRTLEANCKDPLLTWWGKDILPFWINP